MRSVFGKLFAVMTVVLCSVLLWGCATSMSPEGEVLKSYVIKRATAEYIEQASDPVYKAGRVVHFADYALALLDGSELSTVDLLVTAVVEEIDLDSLSPLDRMTALDLIAMVKTRLVGELEARNLDGDTVLQIRAVIGDIRAAAGMYLGA